MLDHRTFAPAMESSRHDSHTITGEANNRRDISLTFCVGVRMEHAFLARSTDYLEDNDILPYTMLGFRRHLSCQDTILQLKHQIIYTTDRSTKAILGFNLRKAFDNVTHTTKLQKVNVLNMGTPSSSTSSRTDKLSLKWVHSHHLRYP